MNEKNITQATAFHFYINPISVIFFLVSAFLAVVPLFADLYIDGPLLFAILSGVVFITGVILIFAFSVMKLVITDKRVYLIGALYYSKSLPVDKISVFSTGIFGKFAVATSAGKIKVFFATNIDFLEESISKLVLKQDKVDK